MKYGVKQITEAILAQGILPLYFHADEAVSIAVLKTIYKAGVKAVEYTARGEAALSNFAQMVAVRDSEMQDLLLGVGTIKNLQQAKDYLTAGADFLVSPGWVPEIAAHCVEHDIFYAPGCMTPGEIIAAENAGIGFIKLFPGNILGIEFLTTIRDIFPKLLFMPTGGVDITKASMESWFNAGVCAVGMGSKLISKKLMEARDYNTMEQQVKDVLQIIHLIKTS